ncbi:MAG: hypothetical protein NT045_06370 [Candidatus Aureabacteria bacterium]|nr:hypothetical protein [Candidatus Auribacterota bacterium]
MKRATLAGFVCAGLLLAVTRGGGGEALTAGEKSRIASAGPDFIYFLAVDVPDGTQHSIKNRQNFIGDRLEDKYRSALPYINPQPPEMLHITLQQIGRVTDEDIVYDITEAMGEVARDPRAHPFDIADSVKHSQFEIWHNGYFVYRLDRDDAGVLTGTHQHRHFHRRGQPQQAPRRV